MSVRIVRCVNVCKKGEVCMCMSVRTGRSVCMSVRRVRCLCVHVFKNSEACVVCL
jgi:hypothetical protein